MPGQQYPPGLEGELGREATPAGTEVAGSLRGGAEQRGRRSLLRTMEEAGPSAPGWATVAKQAARLGFSPGGMSGREEALRAGGPSAQVRVGGASGEPDPNCLACVELCRGVCTLG